MPWWSKHSSKDEKKKSSKESIIDAFNRKLGFGSEDKSSCRSRKSSRRRRDEIVSERGAISRLPSRSPSPSTRVSRCQSFAARSPAVPLPRPALRTAVTRIDSGSQRPGSNASLPLPKPHGGGGASNVPDSIGAEADFTTASVSSGSSVGDNPSDSILSPLASDCENGNRTALNISSRDQPMHSNKNSAEMFKPVPNLSHKNRRPLGTHVKNLQIPKRDLVLCSAPDSLLSSPSRSPMRSFVPDQVSNHGLLIGKPYPDVSLLGSGQCSSPGSGYNSGNNSIGGDMSAQLFWPQSRCSPECSPVPSPRMTSPGPSSRIQSGAVTPLHPRAGGSTTGSPTRRLDDSKQQSHRLPLPPLLISNTFPLSPTYSAATSPSVPRSPARAEATVSPGSRWKKGRLLGMGSFGHVYLGFNSESGEMCAMKEVTLCSDDAKSRESAQQLGQEIAVLSRLRHPNIVQYYGSETVDDKLYIYLEYVSGGSIYKLLQEYGQFGENAIRNYTQQILSGLAYLHAKNTVHRDIKGANILVDPHGRVKVADFGMAKHITAQSGPLSFKGSPYWMAPEVIQNSSGSNLAVDIWSLGCTVLEMATTKPPWSQYEGVPAMFKIGNSKDLPDIPNHLSEEGKDFVRKCLQRNPANRPTAAKLLEHAFVKNVMPLERPLVIAESAESMNVASSTMRSLDIGHTRSLPLDSEDTSNYQQKGLKPGLGFSTSQSPRNMSCPISPVGSPIFHSHSPHISGRRSPSPISSPHVLSGSSTPLTAGGGAIPFHHQRQTTINLLQEGIGSSRNPGSAGNFYTNSYFQEPRQPRSSPRTPPHVFWDNNGSIQPGYNWNKDNQPVLSDHVSQQLLSEHLKLKSLNLRPGFSTPPGSTNRGP
ncbi:Mitogen-activated protein kinase kinase kinase YODA [Raphanus sativus]|uniref:mitogen-activated protein kinase kinase kinase n=1 Tax=Raphanus sativus TaxID=3726 RepID=A0A6J0L8Q8_RAPSA|nr:mitogen-activated protein kinase kinase kinase YODA [Raphanus sativus]KAJ4877286.1 Mitogen-activated protein kinase kinase kinase YODA [Raphanus sativus]